MIAEKSEAVKGVLSHKPQKMKGKSEMKIKPETMATITSSLAELLLQYSYEFQHQRDREVASARGRYIGYLSALRDAKILDVQTVSDLTCLYVQVEGSPIEPPASIAECAELIKSVLK